MWLHVEGHRYQNGSTKTVIFGVRQVVSYISQFMSLQPGDVISTGTPPGVGMGIKPNPIWLKPGQSNGRPGRGALDLSQAQVQQIREKLGACFLRMHLAQCLQPGRQFKRQSAGVTFAREARAAFTFGIR
mgnify:CR=1 FL=1